MNLIKHIIEPNRLLLIWQAPEGCDRTRRVIGELRRVDDNVVLKYLTDSDDFEAAQKCGFKGYPAFMKFSRIYDEGVLETFMKRLPPRNRPDFAEYLENLRIPSDAKLSDFALLGYSGAKLPSDWFAIAISFDDVREPCEFLTEVAGFRYYEGMKMEVPVGASVDLEADPENQHDPMAIKVTFDGHKIGYIGRGQLVAFHKWLNNDQITAVVEKSNGRTDRPSIMLFVTVL
jgi:hypothetical protein